MQNGNIINYTGAWSSTKTYSLGQCVTYNDKWYVSNLNNNTNHTPQATSDTWWEILSEPTITLSDYYTKVESDTRFMLNTMLNTMFPVGSIVMTGDGSVHALAIVYPSKLAEVTDSDIAYLAIGNNSSSSNSGSFTIQQNQLPNLRYALDWTCFTKDGSTSITAASNPNNLLTGVYRNEVKKTYNYQNFHTDAAVNKVGYTFQLNGGVNQIPITYTVKPKTVKVRMWRVISQLV